jgi:phosphoribosylamine--glycine ligase
LIGEGHEVRVGISHPLARGTMVNMIPRTENWRAELDWIREAGSEGILVFEAIGFGELQDRLRADGFNVIGGSALGDRLENERAFAQDLLVGLGLQVAETAEFTDVDNALSDLANRQRRCVLKLSASAGETFIGALPDGRDIAALLRVRPPEGRFILMDYVEGIEIGVGAFFNGQHFLRPACLDWEHKHFFAGDRGELTGEMGTVATFDFSETLFDATLAKTEAALRAANHVGWVNLNMIVNADGIWPLEFTCRFGYPGFAVLEPLQALGWGELFKLLLDRATGLPTHQGFSVGIVLSTPPFPYSRETIEAPVGLPILLDCVENEHLHLGEVGLQGDQIVTSGLYGWTAVVTGTGETIQQAQTAAYVRANNVITPNLRYRDDIGQKLVRWQFQQLINWGWIKSIPSSRIASQIVR